MPAAAAAMGGGADTGSGWTGLLKKFCLTGTSSMMAEAVTFPVDITKTRLQLQGQADFVGTKMGFGGMCVLRGSSSALPSATPFISALA